MTESAIRETMDAFRLKTTDHKRLKTIREEILRTLRYGGHQLMIVVGPTGVGKKGLRRQVMARSKEIVAIDAGMGRTPALWMDATPPFMGVFSWPDFFRHLLESGHEPLISQKIIYPDEKAEMLLMLQGVKAPPALLASSIKMLVHRRPIALVLDESQHIVDLKNELTVARQLNILKCLAERSGTVLVLLGTYKLASALELNGELLRRSKVMHFQAYKPDNGEDVTEFKMILRSMQTYLPIESSFALEDKHEFLMEWYAGCVGLLKDWIDRALVLALDKGDTKLMLSHLRHTAMSKGELGTILKEMEDGEKAMKLFFKGERNPGFRNREEKKKTTRGRVGQRRPTRDDVGLNREDRSTGLDIDSRV